MRLLIATVIGTLTCAGCVQVGQDQDYVDGVVFARDNPEVCEQVEQTISESQDSELGRGLAEVEWSTFWVSAMTEADPDRRVDLGRAASFAAGVVDTCIDT